MNFRKLPKIDLHLHLDGAVRMGTIRSLAREQGVRLPRPLAPHVTVDASCRSLLDFLRRFDVYLPLLRSPEAVERIAFELAEDCAKDGVVYFETRYAPMLQDGPSCSLEESVQAALRGLQRGRRKFGVESGLILCFMRTNPEQSLRTAKAAHRYGAAGIDIAGEESAPATPHEPAFRFAIKQGLPVTVHAGEAGPVANVWEAIDRLGARRIGHGVRAVEDPRLLRRLARDRILIESCITSNLQTGAVKSLSRHPVRTFLESDIPVCLNTDDPQISRTMLSREYALAARGLGFTGPDFRRMQEHALTAAFCSDSLRKRLRARLSG